MSLQPEDVLAIAPLARLHLEADEIPQMTGQLSGILDLVEQMNAADTRAVEAMAHPLDEVQRLRSDEVTEPDRRRGRFFA